MRHRLPDQKSQGIDSAEYGRRSTNSLRGFHTSERRVPPRFIIAIRPTGWERTLLIRNPEIYPPALAGTLTTQRPHGGHNCRGGGISELPGTR